MSFNIIHGDCREIMATLASDSVDAIVCDPPYGLSFMGKGWDHGVPGVEFWTEAMRVAKPGAHLLAFGGTRTFHRLACAIEDAGWEIRDCVMWVYGSGFPKSHDVSKAIDKAAGAEREVVGDKLDQPGYHLNGHDGGACYGGGIGSSTAESRARAAQITAPATDAARQWQGWGTALKPAWEPIIVARKPLCGTVAENVLRHGTGGINVDGCRVGTGGGGTHCTNRDESGKCRGHKNAGRSTSGETFHGPDSDSGRWPANLIHDGNDEVMAGFPQNAGASGQVHRQAAKSKFPQGGGDIEFPFYGDYGSAARFFKCCPPDATCPLCCLPHAGACDSVGSWKSTLASIAEKRGWTSQATGEFIARVSAIGPASERIVPHVRSAGNLCDSCAISIAVALVATKTSAFSSEELQVILASTGSCNASILLQNLAFFAELLANTDTIPTTNSLSLLFGSVRDAIASCIKTASEERAAADSGPAEATRFRYVAKASKADRDEGCEALPVRQTVGGGGLGNPMSSAYGSEKSPSRNHHPTVKPTALMRYLCRLVTPPGGTVLDPFCGSGSTGKGAVLEGFNFIGIEREAEYVEIARARVAAVVAPDEPPLFRQKPR